jgi:hypothetical protein
VTSRPSPSAWMSSEVRGDHEAAYENADRIDHGGTDGTSLQGLPGGPRSLLLGGESGSARSPCHPRQQVPQQQSPVMTSAW